LAVSVTRNIVLEQSHAKPDIVKGMILLYPTVFHPDQIPAVYRSLHTSSIQHKDNVPLVDGNSMRLFFDLAGTHASDMDYFPALDISCHSRFPPTYVATSEMDSLRDDDRVLAQSLKDAGIRLKTDHYSGLPHCFWIVPSLPETREFMQNSHSGIQYILDQLYRQIVRLELFIIMSNAVHFLWFVVPTDRTSVDP
jgi:versiconal hemiacetal acetate esterase